MLQLAEEIVLFDKSKHQRDSFDCGNEALNLYLKQHLSQNLKQNLIQAYVALEKDSHRVLGSHAVVCGYQSCRFANRDGEKVTEISDSGGFNFAVGLR